MLRVSLYHYLFTHAIDRLFDSVSCNFPSANARYNVLVGNTYTHINIISGDYLSVSYHSCIVKDVTLGGFYIECKTSVHMINLSTIDGFEYFTALSRNNTHTISGDFAIVIIYDEGEYIRWEDCGEYSFIVN